MNAVDVKTRGQYYYYQHQKDGQDRHKDKGRTEPASAEAQDATFIA